MGKLKQVSVDELNAVIETADDLAHEIIEIADRVEKGYSDLSGTHDESLATLNRLARNALQLVNCLHTRARMERDADDLRVLLEERLRKQAQ